MLNNEKYANLLASSRLVEDAFKIYPDKVREWRTVVKDSKITINRIVKIITAADNVCGNLLKNIFNEDILNESPTKVPAINNIRKFRMLVATQIVELVRAAVNSSTKYVKDIEQAGVFNNTVKMYGKILSELQEVLEKAEVGKVTDYGNFDSDVKVDMLVRRLVEVHLAGAEKIRM